MIRFEHVTFTYPDAEVPTLVDVDFVVPEGELCLVVGTTGSGKSTLLRAVNGLVPRFSGGTLQGRVWVDGRSTEEVPPRELADVVGLVGQDPAAGFVTDVVEDELAHVMENLGRGARRDAAPGRGRARPARSARAAPPSARRAVGRPAAAGGHRFGAHRRAPGAGARRADLGPRPGRRRGGPRRADPAGARPRDHRAAGRASPRAGRAVRRPGGARRRAGASRSWSAIRRRSWPPRRSCRPSSPSVAWPAGRRCRCRCATPAAPPPTCAPASPPSSPPTTAERRVKAPLGRPFHARSRGWSAARPPSWGRSWPGSRGCTRATGR